MHGAQKEQLDVVNHVRETDPRNYREALRSRKSSD